jgi:hypothetical protein
MSFDITCPSPGDDVVVNTSGSGATNSICVRGDMLAKLPPQGQFLPAQRIRVTVQTGAGSGSAPNPDDPTLHYADAFPSGMHWCAPNVPVLGYTGAALGAAIYAWLGYPGSWSAPQSVVNFTIGGPGAAQNCYSGCVSGSSFVSLGTAPELASTPDLEVIVADGQNAGTYQAIGVSTLRWSVTIAGVTYTIATAGKGLVIQGPSGAANSATLASNPFSATFPGKFFGATSDVVVTVA